MFTSDRHFVASRYQHGHGLLLFRSAKGYHGAATRIDVLFQDVRAVELRFWTKGLTIREVDESHVAAASSQPGALIQSGNRVYAVGGEGWNGFVVGGIVRTCEDDGELDDASPLIDGNQVS